MEYDTVLHDIILKLFWKRGTFSVHSRSLWIQQIKSAESLRQYNDISIDAALDVLVKEGFLQRFGSCEYLPLFDVGTKDPPSFTNFCEKSIEYRERGYCDKVSKTLGTADFFLSKIDELIKSWENDPSPIIDTMSDTIDDFRELLTQYHNSTRKTEIIRRNQESAKLENIQHKLLSRRTYKRRKIR